MSPWIKLGEQQFKKQEWDLKEELAKADYKIKTEPVHLHSCPYCGYKNRARKYFPKLKYSKCEDCEKVFFNQCGK